MQVEYVLKNLSRDWSAAGAAERAQTYAWIVDAARQHVHAACAPDDATAGAPSSKARESVNCRVLVPGCGLARLPIDLAAAGFDVVANEFSFYMLLTSAFVMNSLRRSEEVAIHPWVLTTCNQRSDAAQLRQVLIPDVPAATLLAEGAQGGRVSMVTGDFTEVFTDAEYQASFDCVATSFFIDVAHNVIDVIQARLPARRRSRRPCYVEPNGAIALRHFVDHVFGRPRAASRELPSREAVLRRSSTARCGPAGSGLTSGLSSIIGRGRKTAARAMSRPLSCRWRAFCT